MSTTQAQKAAAKETCEAAGGQVIQYAELEQCSASGEGEPTEVERKWLDCVTTDCTLDEVKEMLGKGYHYPSFECEWLDSVLSSAEDTQCCKSFADFQVYDYALAEAIQVCSFPGKWDLLHASLAELSRIESDELQCSEATDCGVMK